MPPMVPTDPTATPSGHAEARPPVPADQDEQEGREVQPAPAAAEGRPTRTATIRLPFLTARFEVAAPPSGEGWRLGPVTLPSPAKTAYYLGLGALAAVEVVEWPVAAALAAGTYVAQHTSGQAAALPHPERSATDNGHQLSSNS
jgi:hypothetical protein